MKKIKDETRERAKKLNNVCSSIQIRFANLALINRLSPVEMMTVAATFSFTLISNISEHFDVDKSRLFECFLDVLKTCAEESK